MAVNVRLGTDRTLLEQTFTRGIVRDTDRNAIPPGGVYDAVDFLFDRPGTVYKRGGSEFQSSELSGESLIVVVAAPEFPGDPRVVAIASDGTDRTLYDVTETTAATGVDINGAQPTENPPLYVDRLIVTDGLDTETDGFYPPQKVYLSTGTVAVADLGGDPPNARCSTVHLDFLVFGNGMVPQTSGTEYPNRVWFGPTGANADIEDTWDTDTAWIDVPSPVTGLASVAGVLLVFQRGRTERILGNIPPGDTGENMELQPLGGVGCIDARSIVKMNGLVYFADESGVYYTNGAGYESITTKRDGSGIGALWAEAVAGYSPSLGSVVCAGVWLNKYLLVSVRHADSDAQNGARYQFLYHAPTGSWTRLSDGVTADMYATRFAPDGEIYAACGDPDDPARLLRLSGIFNPTSSNSSDANGEAVEPQLTFRPVAAGPALKAFGFAHLSGSLDGVRFRSRFDVNTDSQAVTVKVEQSGGTATTEIDSLEMDVRGYDADSETD